jgi:hypothetical protein
MQPSSLLAIPQAMQRHTGCQIAVDSKPVKINPVPKLDQKDLLNLGQCIPPQPIQTTTPITKCID